MLAGGGHKSQTKHPEKGAQKRRGSAEAGAEAQKQCRSGAVQKRRSTSRVSAGAVQKRRTLAEGVQKQKRRSGCRRSAEAQNISRSAERGFLQRSAAAQK